MLEAWEQKANWTSWEAQSDRELLIKCVGYSYGPAPEQHLNEIRRQRGHYGQIVAERMLLSPNDIVLEVGSGCGFIAGPVALRVKRLYCSDISASFLAFCRRELGPLPNVEYHQIGYADFARLHGRSISRAYSTAVFIHFNFYDIYHYLRALGALLPMGGKIYFDYSDAELLSGPDHPEFAANAAGYKADRSIIPTLLQFNSRPAVDKALAMTGFELEETWDTWQYCRSLLARKVRDVS